MYNICIGGRPLKDSRSVIRSRAMNRSVSAFATSTFLAAAVLLPAAGGADTLILWDGQVIEGTIKDEGEAWHVETPTLIYAVAKTSVREIKRSGAQEATAGATPAAPTPAAPAPAATSSPAPSTAPKAIAFTDKVGNTQPPAQLLREAEEAAARKTFGYARECLKLILKFHPNCTEATRARALMREVPDEDGRLLLGFDSAGETQAEFVGKGRHEVQWISDPKVVPDGEGAARIILQRGPHAKFPIPSQSFATLKSVNFWVWSEAPIVGMTGTTYIVLYTDDPKDFMQASFQLKGDGVWRKIKVDAGRFKKRTKNEGRRFTAVGFWNPSPELRDFIVDEVRFIEETPPVSQGR